MRFQKEPEVPKPQKVGETYVRKFFKGDRLAREAFTFLAPEHRQEDLVIMDTTGLAEMIGDFGERLFEEGSLPGLPCWEKEASPELEDSIKFWRQSLEEETGPAYNVLVQKAFRQAEAGFLQLGRLAPRLAALRWAACMNWIANRSDAMIKSSGGGANVSQIPAQLSEAASRGVKHNIIKWLGTIIKEPPVIAIFDFDLLGQGVWHGGGKEPVPTEALDEWYRRGCEFDICMLASQALAIPPFDLNPAVPKLVMVQPYGSPAVHIDLPKVPRLILDKHEWLFQALLAPLEGLPQKVPLDGPVLHMDIPPAPFFDLTDPEVRAKVERGEDLGKGSQEDGLPGALHGSVGLLYAAAATADKITNVRFVSSMLELEGFVEMFLHYGPHLRSISLSGCHEKVDEETLYLMALAGDSMLTLDLSDCGLTGDIVEAVVNTLKELPNVKNLDLAGNALDAQACIRLVKSFSEQRVDIVNLRLDSNPLANPDVLRNEVAAALAQRGESVIAGGDLVFHLGETGVRWCAAPREGQLAQRLREDGADVIRTSSIKEIERAIGQREQIWAKYEKEDWASQSSGGKEWLKRMRLHNSRVNTSRMMKLFRRERTQRTNMIRGDKDGIDPGKVTKTRVEKDEADHMAKIHPNRDNVDDPAEKKGKDDDG
ncbi:unnamed protein product [Polarella glacialis]|uniref:Uncharacterized protein n=1 Tax=Polarella glacialis TaxID=89957 RepID=A0A813JRC8_POLGL|nr:unnamed protein product [Polarella glacialis]CAE8683218.1 unnamed protein product [Polarella glacialis]|mmetsp:Transcript_95421/g.172176  ORF Transcript_95421/g.172176 Transcript_95421/m.172176 type:complete len:655 (-) Transcript_95421:82-2046(-)